jgi:hypothetical protein
MQWENDELILELPFPLPTWNRLLSMHWAVKKKCVDSLHLFVLMSIAFGSDWPTWTVIQSKLYSTELLRQEYLQMIRPNSSRKSVIANLRAEQKVRRSEYGRLES